MIKIENDGMFTTMKRARTKKNVLSSPNYAYKRSELQNLKWLSG